MVHNYSWSDQKCDEWAGLRKVNILDWVSLRADNNLGAERDKVRSLLASQICHFYVLIAQNLDSLAALLPALTRCNVKLKLSTDN